MSNFQKRSVTKDYVLTGSVSRSLFLTRVFLCDLLVGVSPPSLAVTSACSSGFSFRSSAKGESFFLRAAVSSYTDRQNEE